MKAFFATLALAAVLAGCSLPAQLRSSPDVRYYVLSSPLPASSTTELATIGVLPVTLPGYLMRQQIVLRDADGINISINEYERWGESLSQGISRVLCDSLAVRGVPALPLRTGAKVSDRLMLDVRRLDGQVLSSGHMVKSRPAGDSMESMVRAQSLLVQDLAEDIAGRLR